MSESKEKENKKAEKEEGRPAVEMGAVCEVRSYTDDQSRRVHEFTPAFRGPDEEGGPVAFYKGEAMLIVDHPKAGEQSLRLEFMFEGVTTLEGAYLKWDETAEKEKELWVKEQTELAKKAEAEAKKKGKKVIMPSKGSKKGLLGVDGQPLFQ